MKKKYGATLTEIICIILMVSSLSVVLSKTISMVESDLTRWTKETELVEERIRIKQLFYEIWDILRKTKEPVLIRQTKAGWDLCTNKASNYMSYQSEHKIITTLRKQYQLKYCAITAVEEPFFFLFRIDYLSKSDTIIFAKEEW